MKILVTGGTGYIGSHTVVELLNSGYEVVVIDNLYNSKIEVVDKIKKITGKDFTFYKGDVCDKELLEEIFTNHDINGILCTRFKQEGTCCEEKSRRKSKRVRPSKLGITKYADTYKKEKTL